MDVIYKFKKIYFIESDKNKSEGKDLFTSIIEVRCFQQKLECEYISVANKSDFTKSLQGIAKDTKSILPYIHIECHGSTDGLVFSSGEGMDWEDFGDLLTTINVTSRNNLFVSMATCYGGYLSLSGAKNIAMGVNTRAPVCGFIGPSDEINYEQLESGFYKYFDCLLTTGSFTDALKLLNTFSDYKPGYVINTCHSLFRNIIENYIRIILSDRFTSTLKYEAKVQELLSLSFKTTGIYPTIKDYNKYRNALLKKEFYLHLLNEIGIKYFMHDLFPENKRRFPLLSDIENWSAIIKNVKR